MSERPFSDKFDIVGSFLPSPELIEARNAFDAGRIDATAMRSAEDKAIASLVERQLKAGLPFVTSGELRRRVWNKDFYFGLGGIEKGRVEADALRQNLPAFADLMLFKAPISYNPEHPFFNDFKFLYHAAAGRAQVRQTIPSPADLYLEILTITDDDPGRVYPSPETLIDDIAGAYRETIRGFYNLGCRHLQLDDTAAGQLADSSFLNTLILGGINPVKVQNDIITLLNKSVEGLPADMGISLFVSGGANVVPAWRSEDTPDNVLANLLRNVNIRHFFLPFSPSEPEQLDILRFLRPGSIVTLGLLSAHMPFSDKIPYVRNAIEHARQYLPAEAISISPTSGFKLSSFAERGLTEEDQWHKIDQLRSIAADL